MNYGFGLQKLSNQAVNKKAFDKERFYIHFEDIPSTNPKDYEKGKTALNILWEFCNEGAIIAVDYTTIDKSNIYIGKVSPGSEIESENISGSWYKYIRLKDRKKIPYSQYPILNSNKPIKQTVCRWRKLDKRLEYIYYRKDLPEDVSSLTSEQLELICSEYLKMFGIVLAPTLKVGGSQPKIDLSGIGIEGKKVFAQVSFKVSEKKIIKLKYFESEDSLLFYFGPKKDSKKLEDDDSVIFIPIDLVFNTLSKYPYSTYYIMIQEMLFANK